MDPPPPPKVPYGEMPDFVFSHKHTVKRTRKVFRLRLCTLFVACFACCENMCGTKKRGVWEAAHWLQGMGR